MFIASHPPREFLGRKESKKNCVNEGEKPWRGIIIYLRELLAETAFFFRPSKGK
jgi:hypothetical protein